MYCSSSATSSSRSRVPPHWRKSRSSYMTRQDLHFDSISACDLMWLRKDGHGSSVQLLAAMVLPCTFQFVGLLQGISRVQLRDEDVMMILNTLEYDGQIERVAAEDGECFRRALLAIPDTSAFTSVPCGVCPVSMCSRPTILCTLHLANMSLSLEIMSLSHHTLSSTQPLGVLCKEVAV